MRLALAGLADAVQFDGVVFEFVAVFAGGGAEDFGEGLVVDFPHLAAFVAHHHDVAVIVRFVEAEFIGVLAFELQDEACVHQEVERPVEADGREVFGSFLVDEREKLIGRFWFLHFGHGQRDLAAEGGQPAARLVKVGFNAFQDVFGFQGMGERRAHGGNLSGGMIKV